MKFQPHYTNYGLMIFHVKIIEKVFHSRTEEMETTPAMGESENLTLLRNVTSMIGSSGPSTLKMVFDVVIKVSLIIIMLGMGSVTEIDPLLKHIKRPTGILIGMTSQFVVLPLVTFGLAHALIQFSTF